MRRVLDDFNVDVELLDLARIKSTTTGENLILEVLKMTKKCKFDSKKLSGLTTAGLLRWQENIKNFGSIRSRKSCFEPLHYPSRKFVQKSSE